MHNFELQPCPVCETALDLQGPIYSNTQDLLNDVYVCRACGLIHKPILNFSEKFNTDCYYSVESFDCCNDVHLLRMKNIVDMVEQRFTVNSDDAILDVGAGTGLFYEAISSRKPVKKYVALEPVPGMASHMKKLHPEIFVLNSSIDRAIIPENLFNVVFVLGVDYLFQNIDLAYRKIQRCLKPDGYVVIQRSVFIDQAAYVGKEIVNMEDMFGSNLLMRNWFSADQYSEFLSKYFIISETVRDDCEFQDESGRSFKMFQLTYFCRPRKLDEELKKQVINSYYDTNMVIVDNLQRKQAEIIPSPVPPAPVAKKSLRQKLWL